MDKRKDEESIVIEVRQDETLNKAVTKRADTWHIKGTQGQPGLGQVGTWV